MFRCPACKCKFRTQKELQDHFRYSLVCEKEAARLLIANGLSDELSKGGMYEKKESEDANMDI